MTHLHARIGEVCILAAAALFLAVWVYAEWRADHDERWSAQAHTHGNTAECIERLLRMERALQQKDPTWPI